MEIEKLQVDARDLQWKNDNNHLAMGGYFRGVVSTDDCVPAGSKLYIGTLGEGVIIKNLTAFIKGDSKTLENKKINAKLNIGVGDCSLCEPMDLTITANPECSEVCDCKITDKPYLVRLDIADPLVYGDIYILMELIRPDALTMCVTEPIVLNYETTIVDPCIDECCDRGCSVSEKEFINVVSVVSVDPESGAITICVSNEGNIEATGVVTSLALRIMGGNRNYPAPDAWTIPTDSSVEMVNRDGFKLDIGTLAPGEQKCFIAEANNKIRGLAQIETTQNEVDSIQDGDVLEAQFDG